MGATKLPFDGKPHPCLPATADGVKHSGFSFLAMLPALGAGAFQVLSLFFGLSAVLAMFSLGFL